MLKGSHKTLILIVLIIIFMGCSSKSMYTTGTTIDKILPRHSVLGKVVKIITDPLKANEEAKMRKIAEEKRVRKEREYKEWFSSLSKEEQQEEIAKKERIAVQNRRMIGKLFDFMISSAANSSPNTLDPRGDPRIYRKSKFGKY